MAMGAALSCAGQDNEDMASSETWLSGEGGVSGESGVSGVADSGPGSGDSQGSGEDGSDDGPDDPGSPYQGGWDIGDCQDSVYATAIYPGSIEPGDVLQDWLLIDQFGELVRLYDFCHKVLYYEVATIW